jgi:hypothetical protein
MLALIDPRFDRVCQVETVSFPVADPLFWMECPDDCNTNWTYSNGKLYPPISENS